MILILKKMKKNSSTYFCLFVFFIFWIILPVCAQDKTGTGYYKTLTWSDEFNDATLNTNYWGYEIGYVRNSQTALQYYTSRTDNVRLENGNLVIEGKKENYGGYSYTSGDIQTKNKVTFSGDFRIEVRAKLPKGGGVWPAIWLMGVDGLWPACSELDIMEHVGSNPTKIFGTFHWQDTNTGKHLQDQTSLTITDIIHTDYIIYALERVGSNFKIFYNDFNYKNFNAPSTAVANSFTQPMFLLLNFGLGGGNWVGPIDDSILPQQYLIDYVRVYALSKDPPQTGVESIETVKEMFAFEDGNVVALCKANFEVFDFEGRKTIQKSLAEGEKLVLSKGLYIVRANDGIRTYSKSLSILH